MLVIAGTYLCQDDDVLSCPDAVVFSCIESDVAKLKTLSGFYDSIREQGEAVSAYLESMGWSCFLDAEWRYAEDKLSLLEDLEYDDCRLLPECKSIKFMWDNGEFHVADYAESCGLEWHTEAIGIATLEKALLSGRDVLCIGIDKELVQNTYPGRTIMMSEELEAVAE